MAWKLQRQVFDRVARLDMSSDERSDTTDEYCAPAPVNSYRPRRYALVSWGGSDGSMRVGKWGQCTTVRGSLARNRRRNPYLASFMVHKD